MLGLLLVAVLSADEPAAEPAPAADPAPEELPSPPTFAKKVEINGYVSNRLGYGRSRWSGLIPTIDSPQWLDMTELNGQLKVSYHEHGFAYVDLSAIALVGFDYRYMNDEGVEEYQLTRDAAAARPLISINEAYVLQEAAPWLNFLVGKKRIVWGPGLAFNPTDLLNVRKDPTDPTFQRAGAWLARIEVPLESSAFTLLFAPQVTQSAFGIPYGMVTYPEWDKQDDQPHYLVGARAYFLVADTDINVLAYFSNRYFDDFENKVRTGASFSRIFFDTWELHAEGLLQQGSSRTFVEHDCVVDVQAALACNAQKRAFAARSRLFDPTWVTQLLAGVRKTFDDDSFISVEYLFQSDGYRPDQYQDLINAFDGINQARAFGLALPAGAGLLIPNAGGGGADQATPSRFNFAPTGKHYAFITFQKPRIKDDFTAQVVVLMNLQDLSTLWTPSITWSTTEWLSLSLIGFIPAPGPDALAAKVPSTGKYISEYGSFPQLFRAFFEVRIFY
ncbi:MAG: hypothetical protein JNK82_19820 [Myxococcaceae bacterium]|nr:hypothetical protein [Myxococcaceae bacterium]